jgi:hypothetical protein
VKLSTSSASNQLTKPSLQKFPTVSGKNNNFPASTALPSTHSSSLSACSIINTTLSAQERAKPSSCSLACLPSTKIETEFNLDNYKETFKEFLETFTEKKAKSPKYVLVAREIMSNRKNIFHFTLEDLEVFNSTLADFIDGNYEKLGYEFTKLIKKFIEDFGLGECTGLYHYHSLCRGD